MIQESGVCKHKMSLNASAAKYTWKQGWVMRPFAQTNARMVQIIRIFNVNASAFRGHFSG